MKKIYMLALSLLPLCASAQSLVVTLQSGEKVKYPIAAIQRLSFEETQVTPPEQYVPLSSFTDAVLNAEVAKADADGDGQLSEAEIATITELDLKNSEVASLEGIQYLTSLRELNLQSCMALTEVDLTAGPASLEMLQTGFSSNLKSLKLGEKPSLRQLYVMYTGLTEIDLSGLPVLEEVSVMSTPMTSVSVRDNKSLRVFTAGSESLQTVDLAGCDNLTNLTLSGVTSMTGFDISSFPALETFSMTNSKVREFSTLNNPALKELSLDFSESLSKVDVSKSMKLERLSCLSCWELETVVMTEGQVVGSTYGVSDYMITYVEREYPEDIAAELKDETFRAVMIAAADTDGDGKISAAEAQALTELNASGKGLSSVDFFYFNNIEELDLSDNALAEVDLSPMAKLRTLNLDNNKLTALGISRQKDMEILSASGNEISSSIEFNSSSIREVNLSHNKLTAIKLTYKYKLVKVDVSYNQLTDAQILGNSALADMDVSHNSISQMTLWSLAGLVNVKFNDNLFTQLDESVNWTKLETIDCSNTQISKLDLSKTTSLTGCTATGCPNLETIYIGENTGAEIVKDDNTTVVEGSPAE